MLGGAAQAAAVDPADMVDMVATAVIADTARATKRAMAATDTERATARRSTEDTVVAMEGKSL